MIKHIVIWKLKNKNDGPQLKAAIEGLQGKIPGLLGIEAGIDFNCSTSAGDLVLISKHEDKASLAIYQSHPDHVDVKNQIIPLVSGSTVVDFEV